MTVPHQQTPGGHQKLFLTDMAVKVMAGTPGFQKV